VTFNDDDGRRLSATCLLAFYFLTITHVWDITFAGRNFTARERDGKRRLRLENSFYAGKFVAAVRAEQLTLIFVDFHKIARRRERGVIS